VAATAGISPEATAIARGIIYSLLFQALDEIDTLSEISWGASSPWNLSREQTASADRADALRSRLQGGL
jgi:hypothetical protein